jgi:hypothetical protein
MAAMTFMEALLDACIHGELTREMVEEWLEGEDLAAAVRIIASGRFVERSPEEREEMERAARLIGA